MKEITTLVKEAASNTLKDMQASGTILVGVNNKAIYTESVGLADIKNNMAIFKALEDSKI